MNKFVCGLFALSVGVGVGFVIGVLAAPKSGQETQEDIKNAIDDMREVGKSKVEDIVDKSKSTVSAMVEKGKGATQKIKTNPKD